MANIKHKDSFRLNESPDIVELNGKKLKYIDSDAIPFVYDPFTKIGMIGEKSTTHAKIIENIGDVLFKKIHINSAGYLYVNGTYIWVYHKSLKDEELSNHLLKNTNEHYFSDFITNDDSVDAGYIHGRIWENSKVASFWNKRKEVMSHIDDIKKLIKFETGKSSDDYLFEFVEDYEVGPKKLDDDSSKEISDEEYKKLIAHQHIDPQAKNKLKDLGMIKASPQKEPEWKKEFQESTKLKDILQSLKEDKEKHSFEIKNVYLNGKRIEGITQAYSESQALFNLIYRNLPEINRKELAPLKVSEAKRIGGYKISKLASVTKSDKDKKYWWQKDD